MVIFRQEDSVKEISPVKVRQILESQGRDFMLADSDWYSRFCEAYTHVSPDTKPNMHNDEKRAFAGGIYQPNGLSMSLGELATALGIIAIIVSKYVGLEDLFDEISKIIDAADQMNSTSAS